MKYLFAFILNPKVVTIFTIIFSISCLSFALIAQHYFNILPCAWCVLQRLIFVFLILVSFASLFFKRLIIFQIINVITSASGIVASLYLYLVASKSDSCDLSFAEKFINLFNLQEVLPSVFGVLAMCNEPQVRFLGISFVQYAILSFVLLFVLCLYSLFLPRGSK